MVKKTLKLTIVLITILIFLYAFSSSYNSQNIDHLDYVVALCIDTIPNSSDLKVSFEFANLSSFSENNSSENDEPIINTIVSPSISSAINIMNGYLGKQINLSHCKVIVFSKDFAQSGILDEVAVLVHNIQIRPTTNLIISEGQAVTYVKNSISSLEQILTKYYDLFPTSSEYTGYTSNVPLGKFYENLQNKHTGAVTILGKEIENSNKQSSKESDKKSSSESTDDSNKPTDNSTSKKSNSTPSDTSSNVSNVENSTSKNTKTENNISEQTINNQTDYQSINPNQSILEGDHGTENMGLAVFKGDKYVGELSTIETLCYSLIKDEVDNFLVTLESPFDKNQKVDIYTNSLSQLDIDLDLSNDYPIIYIDLSLTAEVLNTLSEPQKTYDEVLDELNISLKQYLEKEFQDYLYKTSKEFKSDINEFYKIAKKEFLTNYDFENYNWAEKYENAEFHIYFNENIISTIKIQK